MNTRLTVTAAVATIAASIALHPLIGGSTWFWEGAGAVVVVAAAGALTRLRTLPVLACLLIMAGALLLYLNLVFSWRDSFGGLPTLASLRGLYRLNELGWTEAARFAPPVPGFRAVSFLAVCGIGLAALGTDLLAVRLRRSAAAGLPLLALFSATVASKASVPGINEAAIFCVGVAGYLALLVADGRERIQVWGRLVSAQATRFRVPSAPQHTQRQPAAGQRRRSRDGAAADTQALSAAGRRVGMAAVAAALLIPLLIPGLKVRDLFGGGGGGTGHAGGASATLPDPLVQMNSQLRVARAKTILMYHSDNPNPPYLRVYSLELSATADSWGLSVQQATGVPRGGTLPGAPGLLSSTPYRTTHTTVSVSNGVSGAVTSGTRTQNFLPLPYPAVKVDVGSGWAVDPSTLMVWSVNPISGLKYTVTSKDVEPSAAQLRAVSSPISPNGSPDLGFPAAYVSLAKLAQKITQGATTQYDKAIKLQQYFTLPGNFAYSLNATEENTPAGLRDFLLHSKRGFCQQFAFAFAVLARLLGIPARVAVGYTAGTSQGNGNWRVTTADAHAWPELYFPGMGWLPWEPTPAGIAVGQATAKPPLYTLPSLSGAGGINSAIPGGSTGAPSGTQPGLPGIATHQRVVGLPNGHAPQTAGHGPQPWQWLLIALAALAVVTMLAPVTTRQLTRLRRLMIISRGRGRPAAGGGASSGGGAGSGGAGAAGPADTTVTRARVHAAWLEIHDDLEDFGVGCHPNESPRAIARRVRAQLSLAAAPGGALRRVALAEERARYAPRLDDLRGLRADVVLVHRSVAASVSPRSRWRGRILPASKITALKQAARHALDVFGWMEEATSWLTARIRPGRPRRAGRAPAS